MSEQAPNITQLARKYANRKMILGGMAMLSGVAMIVLFTFVPYTWDPDRLLTGAFLTDTLINAAITVLGMVCMIFISQTMNSSNAASKIAKALKSFKETKDKISDKHAFKQWIKKVQQPKDLHDIKERILNENGIDDLRLLNLSEPEIKGLLNTAQRYNGTYYGALNAEQVKALLGVKRGIKVHFPRPEAYLSAHTILDNRTPSERINDEGSKKRNFALLSIGSKVLMVFLVSMIFTMFVKDMAEELDPLEAAGKFAIRMLNFFSSGFMGFIVGGQLNDIDAEYIDLRTNIFEEFLSDKDFKSKTIEEEAKDEFVERVRREQVLKLPPG